MKHSFNWGSDNIIDSRDIIEQYEELEEELESLRSELSDCESNLTDFLKKIEEDNSGDNVDSELKEFQDEIDNASEALNGFDHDEYKLLESIVEQGNGCSDWSYGQSLIKDSYFEEHTQELIDDCYDLPAEFSSGEWPYRHMSLDITGAAEELKQDYTEIEADGETYYIRY